MIKRVLIMAMIGITVGTSFAAEIEINEMLSILTEDVGIESEEEIVIEEALEEQIEQIEEIEEKQQIERSVSIRIDCPDTVCLGDNITLYAVLKGYEGVNYHIQWQVSKDNDNWKDISGANNDKYAITIAEENVENYYRVTVTIE